MLLRMAERVAAVPVTLCFVRAGEHVLLLRADETKDRFRGLWNGLGGHVRPGEDVRAAARRELREESGLEPEALQLRAVVQQMERHTREQAYFLFLYSPIQLYAVNKTVHFRDPAGHLNLVELSVTDQHWSMRKAKVAGQ